MPRASLSRGRAYAGAQSDNRERIAQVAARLILEHGITDWSLAKRKAARQLMLSERDGLPGDDEVEAALTEHQALYGGDEHAATLRAQREEALRWMRRLADFNPRLVGGVAAGWAGEYNDIRLELIADDQKAVELVLINAEVSYRVGPMRSAAAPAQLYIDTRAGGVRLTIMDEREARSRKRDDVRLDAAALARLLDSP
ncbi:MAG TPA: hypothetical protein VLR71_05465 [Casimicrobiaceae bacterium]|nr:hypothetical protein [Casimicrobiaceae bacterium]